MLAFHVGYLLIMLTGSSISGSNKEKREKKKVEKKLILSGTLFRMIGRFNAMPIGIPDAFFVDIDIDIQNVRGPPNSQTILKKRKIK